MAEDVVTLLDYVGWKDDIHVVGTSLGGMIAQGDAFDLFVLFTFSHNLF
jgi:pimeloyl-ACP methyl ester carboxylesterase